MSRRPMQTTGLSARRLAAGATILLVVLCAGAAPAGAASSQTQLHISPSAGPVGSVITISGHLSRADRKDNSNIDYVTAYIKGGHPHAGLEALLRGRLTIAADGSMRLSVTLPLNIEWRANPMTGSTDRLSQTPSPTDLELAWPCRACGIGTFHVTAAATSLPFTGSGDRDLVLLAGLLLVAGCGAVAVSIRR